jgi:hypothetical protein
MLRALTAEIMKLKRSNMPLWTALVVLAAPMFTATPIVLYGDDVSAVGWATFMSSSPKFMASWYGTLLFGLVAAFLFGREYVEGTAKEMLTLPVRREYFFAAKMVVLALWVIGLVVLSTAVQAGVAAALGVHSASWAAVMDSFVVSFEVALLIYAALPWVALLAMVGRGYMAPMVYSSVAAALGLGLAEAGWTRWVPWSMPMSVAGMALFPSVPMPGLVGGSWALMVLVFVTGSAAVVLYMDRVDTL